MGLDAFRTGDTSSQKKDTESDNENDESKQNAKQEATSKHKNKEKERPYFTVVKNRELREITTHKGDNAFPPSGRHKTEKIIQTIQTEKEYERLDKKSREHHSAKLPRLFKQNHALAKDFTQRLSVSNDESEDPICEVCGSKIDITEGNYTKVNNSIVHGDHNILNVVQSLEINDYGN